MKKNILTGLLLISLMSVSLSVNAAIDVKAGLKAGVNASLQNSNVNKPAVNSYKSQINAVINKSNKLSSNFNSAVNNASNLLLSKDELAKVRGNAAVNSAAAADKLAAYLAADAQAANISKKVNSLSADKRAQLNSYVKTMKDSMVGYAGVVKESATLSAQVLKTPSVAAALSSELKNMKQVSANASNQAKLAGKVSSALLGVRK